MWAGGGRGRGRNNSQGYHGDNQFYGQNGRGRGRGRGRGGRGRGPPREQGDQHPGIAFLWNLFTEHPDAIVTCLAYADGTLYVGLDTGVVKIYNYVDAPQANSKKRFEPAEPPEAAFPGCNIKSIVAHDGLVYVARVNKAAACSEIECPNTGQVLRIEGSLEHMGQAERPSLWAGTVSGTIAVLQLAAAGPDGQAAMQPLAEVNRDHSVHKAGVTQLCEVMVTAAGASVLISGDVEGRIGVWNVATGTPMQVVERPAGSAAATTPAISALAPYQGTHFLSGSLDGTVSVWALAAAPSASHIVEVQPIAQYVPQQAPTSFSTAPPGVLACAVAAGPEVAAAAAAAQQLVDWLLVARITGDALEAVKLGPAFEWGGPLARTTRCRVILPLQIQRPEGVEHLVLAGSGHTVKVFRWRTGFD